MTNKYLYKYRPIYDLKQLSFVVDIVSHNKLFLSTPTHFTDPFDGFNVRNSLTHSRAIISFSERKNSKLLWAYYGGWYSGVMIEFKIDLTKKPFKNIQKVKYEIDHLKFINILNQNDIFTKPNEFQHEEEWRLVCDSNDKYLFFPSDFLISVTIGPALQGIYKDELKDICKSSGVDVLEFSLI